MLPEAVLIEQVMGAAGLTEKICSLSMIELQICMHQDFYGH